MLDIQPLYPMIKPAVYDLLLEVEQLFSQMNYTGHHPVMAAALNNYYEDPDVGSAVEDAYDLGITDILKMHSIRVTEEATIRDKYEIMDSIEDAFHPDNSDRLEEFLNAEHDADDDDVLYLSTFLEFFDDSPDRNLMYWMVRIESFDASVINEIREELETPITEEEIAKSKACQKRLKAIKPYLKNPEIAISIIKSRKSVLSMGYKLETMLRGVWSLLDHLVEQGEYKNYRAFADNVVLLWAASDDPGTDTPDIVINSILEEFDVMPEVFLGVNREIISLTKDIPNESILLFEPVSEQGSI